MFAFFRTYKTELLLFVFLIICYFRPYPVGNEEMYFGYAKTLVSPEWFPGNSIFNYWQGTRIVTSEIFGHLLQIMSFKTLTMMSLVLFSGIAAVVFGRLFSLYNLTLMDVLVAMVLFIEFDQSFLCSSSFLLGAEASSISFIIGFLGIYFFLRRTFKPAVLTLVLASYLHPLIGGWIFIFSITVFVFKRDMRLLIRYGGLYFLLMVPYLVYLFFSAPVIPESSIEPSWIYAYVAVPHHLAPLATQHLFDVFIFPMFQVALLFFGLVWVHFKTYHRTSSLMSETSYFMVAVGFWSMIAIGAAFIDKQGIFLQTYPFRSTTVLLLFFILRVLLYLRETRFRNILFILFLVSLTYCAGYVSDFVIRFQSDRNFVAYDSSWEQVIAFSKATPTGTVFQLYLDHEPLIYKYRFSRLTKRDQYSVHKFLPQGGPKIYDWYKRKLRADAFYRDPTRGLPADYVITDMDLFSGVYPVVLKTEDFWVFDVRE